MNTDKAYLLGLIIGGGQFGSAADRFKIRLPYNKWGQSAERAGQVSQDIQRKVGPMFRAVYGFSVCYQFPSSGKWDVFCEGDLAPLRADLIRYGLPCEGNVRQNADIGRLLPELVDDNMKRRFIAGLADTIGSLAKSHRRFSDERQTISFEITGFHFRFVYDLCHLLCSVGCIPDQINWNHPNIHCTGDPYYPHWNKGFKLRVLLDQYAQFGAFAFRAKAAAQTENRKLQQRTHSAKPCEQCDLRVTPSTVHPAENDPRLPPEIRGGHYLHARHFCAVLGCEHAPYDRLRACFREAGRLINPFPILCKDTLSRVETLVRSVPLMAARTYRAERVNVNFLLSVYRSDSQRLLYGPSRNAGYPVGQLCQAAAYVIADENSELTGKRPRGYVEILERHTKADPALCVEMRRPDLLTPLVIAANGRGALIGPENPEAYRKLIAFDAENPYKMRVREITEEDLLVEQ
ncbi:MAG: hypothetical protein IJR54_08995 [Oscillibacter sp.]|nr:hypothetical protein [Oscillibacter sp.]